MIASAVAITAINDIILFDEDIYYDAEAQDHKKRYEEVAWWIIGVGIAAVVLQVVMAISRALYLDGNCVNNFITFAAIVSITT